VASFIRFQIVKNLALSPKDELGNSSKKTSWKVIFEGRGQKGIHLSPCPATAQFSKCS